MKKKEESGIDGQAEATGLPIIIYTITGNDLARTISFKASGKF